MESRDVFVESNRKSDINGFVGGKLNYNECTAGTLNLSWCIIVTWALKGHVFHITFLQFRQPQGE